MIFTEINILQIAEIITYIDKEAIEYFWVESNIEKRWFRKDIYHEAYWYDINQQSLFGSINKLSEKDILTDDRFFIKDKTVYHKPHVKIILSNGNKHIKYFEEEYKLKSYIKNIIALNKDLKLMKI